MTSPLPANTSQTARLMADPPGFAVGWQQALHLPAPAAGAQWSHTVDGRYLERLVSVFTSFQASAVVASRYPVLALVDGDGRTVTEVPVGAAIAAGSLLVASLTAGAPVAATGAGGAVGGYLPDLLLPGDWQWQSRVTNMDPGDQWSAPVLLVQRFPNDAAAIVAGQ